jgi:hypothetical protein
MSIRFGLKTGCDSRDVSHRGGVIKAPKAWALSGLKAYECLPRGKARPKRWRESSPSAELTCGSP